MDQQQIDLIVAEHGDEIVIRPPDEEGRFPAFVFGKASASHWAAYINGLVPGGENSSVYRALLVNCLITASGCGDHAQLLSMIGEFAAASEDTADDIRLVTKGGDATVEGGAVCFRSPKHGEFWFRKPGAAAWMRFNAAIGDSSKSRFQAMLQVCKDSLRDTSPAEMARLESLKEDYPAFGAEVVNKLRILATGTNGNIRPGKR
jgi:hypothetical protein